MKIFGLIMVILGVIMLVGLSSHALASVQLFGIFYHFALCAGSGILIGAGVAHVVG